MGVKFSKIHVDDLQFVYGYLEEKLKYITEKSYSDWVPADVYVALKTKEADLYIAYEKDKDVGFMVTATQQNHGSKPTLYVWAAYQDPKYGYTKNGFDLLEKLAEELQADNIEFQTSRKGWSKIAPKYGYKLVSYVYRKDM
tara:strand:+ start:352 stop:774 length:423 start_codon:yes stop_codon:yes gene_type:complete